MLGIEGVDEAGGMAFFSCNKDDPRQRHIYSAKLDGSGMQALTHEEGMHFGQFAEDGKHYAETYTDTLDPAENFSLCCGRRMQSHVGGARRR